MKKVILAISMLLAVAAVICWQSISSEKPIAIRGDLSAKDVAEIKHIVKQDLRRKILPNFSWTSFKELPANTRNYFKYEIMEINVSTDSSQIFAVVWLNSSTTNVSLYIMSNMPGDWKIQVIASVPKIAFQPPLSAQTSEITNVPPRR